MKLSQDRITVAVASHRDYYRTTLPRLLPRLQAAGVETQQVIIAIAGYPRHRRNEFNGWSVIEADHNSFEFTPLIEILSMPDIPEYVFLMHDTCAVGTTFMSKIAKLDSKNTEYMSVDPVGFSNMGLFCHSFLNEAYGYIESLRNLSKLRAMMAERVFTKMAITGHYQTDPLPSRTEPRDVYGDGVMRVSQTYTGCDLVKYLANYGENAGNIFKP